MLFEIHPESRISYKRLTDADLHRSPRSHQTHIGLSNNSLTFMADNKTEYNAMLIYGSYCDIVPCEVGKISRQSGRQDAPNIKSCGVGNNDNVVKNIRGFAEKKKDLDFYLLWFGLDSGTPVFWLICEQSTDYNILNKFCQFDKLPDRQIRVLGPDNLAFSSILGYTRERLEFVTLDLQKDLEYSAEIESDNPKFKDEDIKKAKSYIQQLGRSGEELINEYLAREKADKRVDNYEWANKSGEVGKPYDFYIKYYTGLEQWVDVKTTEHEFEQAVIVSRNEIKFITSKEASEYAIFRVYSMEECAARLKICSECLKYVKKLQRDVDYMTQSMADYKATIVNYKIAFEPGQHSFNNISSEYSLSMS